MEAALFRDGQRTLAVVVLDVGIRAGSQKEPHALSLVLHDAIVQRSVAFPGLLIEAEGILYYEVDNVKAMTVLVIDRLMEAGLGKFLYKKRKIIFEAARTNSTDERILRSLGVGSLCRQLLL